MTAAVQILDSGQAIDKELDTIEHFIDRLLSRCDTLDCPVCVGIDPVYERLPDELKVDDRSDGQGSAQQQVNAIDRFVIGVLQAVAPHVPCVKFQSACFERYLWRGVEAYHRLVHQARKQGLIVIGDAKRGDIGISADHYAAGCLGDAPYQDLDHVLGPDSLTVNAYLGDDGLRPFVDQAASDGKGVFALVRTSNASSDALQGLRLDDGRTVAQAVAQMIAALGSDVKLIGTSGYSLLGAVVGATKTADIAMLRKEMPQQLFLVPGFGAQGGSEQAVKACFKPDGTGAIITASRSVIYAYEGNTRVGWQKAIEEAAIGLKQQVRSILSS